MKKLFIILLAAISVQMVVAQKVVSELTITYDITVETNSTNPNIINMFNGATTTAYLKQNSHRTDQVNGLGNTTTIYDSKTNTAAILKEYGQQKLMIKLTSANWADFNNKYKGVKYTKTTDKKEIAGYNCFKYNGTLADSTSFVVYATEEIAPEAKDYNAQFKGIKGLVLQYEMSSGTGDNKIKVINTASKVSTTPVPPAKFELPKSGYRVMTYEESIKK
jgi:hypothetical protein